MVDEKKIYVYEDIYNDKSEPLKLIEIMKNVKNCPVLTHGSKKIKMSYFFCSCDTDQKNPICEDCAYTCHKDHSLSQKYENDLPKSCACGLKNHQLNDVSNVNLDMAYQKQCYFYELDLILNRYEYNRNPDNGNTICTFCHFFCMNDKKYWKESKNYEKQKVEEKENLIPCACPSHSHLHIRHIFNYLILFIDQDKTYLKEFSPTHRLNLINKKGASFKNLYSTFLDELEKLETEVINSTFRYNKRMNTSLFYWIIVHFDEISNKLKSQYYFDSFLKEIFNVSLISKILKVKVLDNPAIFTLLKSILRSYQKFTICPIFETFPKLKLNDWANLTPLQRLIISKNVSLNSKLNSTMNKNPQTNEIEIVSSYIICFESMIRHRFENKEGFSIFLSITSFLKKMAKFYLLTYDQIIKFSSLTDDLFLYLIIFNKRNEKNLKNTDYIFKNNELKIVTRIAKIFIYFCYYYNDLLVNEYINSKCEKTNFVHTYTELGNLISKNMIHIFNYIKDESDKLMKIDDGHLGLNIRDVAFNVLVNSNIDQSQLISIKNTKQNYNEKIKKIIFISRYLLSMFIHENDGYILTMKNSLNMNTEQIVRIINDSYLHKEKTFINFIEIQTKSIEEKYFSYFNMLCSFDDLIEHLKIIINSFFKISESSDYKSPIENVPMGKVINQNEDPTIPIIQADDSNLGNKFQKNKDDKAKLMEKEDAGVVIIKSKLDACMPYNLLMGKSFFTFSLIKIFSMENEQNLISHDLLNSIFKILHYFIDNQPDNCVMLMTHHFLQELSNVSINYIEMGMELLIKAIKTIKTYSYNMCSIIIIKKYAIKLAYRSLGKENMFSCLHKLIKIIRLLFEINTIYFKDPEYSIRNDLIKIYKDFRLFNLYKDYLMKLSDSFEIDQELCANEKDFNRMEIFRSIFKNEGGYNLLPKLAFKIYIKFISLINNIFDDNSLINQDKFNFKFLDSNDIKWILRNKLLDLNLRTELLRYFRIFYLDLNISEKDMNLFRKVFTKDCDKMTINNTIFSSEDFRFFTFMDNLVQISGLNPESQNLWEEYELLLYELQNIEEITEKSNACNNKNFKNSYFKYAIIQPCRIYLQKVFSIVMHISGKEFLKIYQLCFYILKMKSLILRNGLFEQPINVENKDELKIKNKNSLLSLDRKANQRELNEVDLDIEKITDPSFKILDYLQIYNIVSKHMKYFSEIPTSIDVVNIFSNQENYNNEKIENYKKEIQSKGILILNHRNKIFELIKIYTQNKLDSDNLAVKNNLCEVHSELQISMGTLLFNFLLFISTQSVKVFKHEIYNKESLDIILKLLMCNTKSSQTEIQSLSQLDASSVNLGYFAELTFKNILSIIFCPCTNNNNQLHENYYSACTTIKIFKFLCEEHNNYFQQIFLKKLDFHVGDVNKFYFYDMMIFVLDKILILSGWDRIKTDVENDSLHYFYGLFSCIVELLIEIVQGTQEDYFNLLLRDDHSHSHVTSNKNIEKNVDATDHHNNSKGGLGLNLNISKNSKFIKYDPVYEVGKALPILLNNIKVLLFNDLAPIETIYRVRKQLVDLLLAFIEEHSCPKKIKMFIMKTYSPESILKSICIALKFYFFKNFIGADGTSSISYTLTYSEETKRKSILERQKKNSMAQKNDGTNKGKKNKRDKRFKKLKFTESFYTFFTELYFKDEEFSQSPEFEFCCSFYNYFKLTLLQYEYKESVGFWDKINNINIDEMVEFNKTTHNLVQPTDSKDKKCLDETEFEIYYIIKFFEQVSKSVKIKLEEIKEPVIVVYTMSPFLKYLSRQSKHQFIETVRRNNRYYKLYALMEETNYFKLEVKRNWNNNRNSKIKKCCMQINFYYVGMLFYLIVVIINVILLAILQEKGESELGSNDIHPNIMRICYALSFVDLIMIILWCIIKLPLYYEIEKEKYIEKMAIMGKKGGQLTFWDKCIILIDRSIIERGEINTFIWLFIFVLIPATSNNLIFLLSFALIAVVNLSKTLSNIALSIVLKKSQLFWTMILSLIVFYVYAAWGFFYIQDRFVDTLHRDVPEKVCSTLIKCWLFVSNEGLRWKAGIGKVLPNVSPFSNTLHFVFNRWIYDYTFFIFWDIVLRRILFGIILDTFRELRKEQYKTDFDRANICYICGIQKDECEKNNENFDEHCEKEHNLWEYVNYMITLRLKDSQDLNATNSYAKEQLESKSISWFPSHNSHEEGSHEEHDEHH